MPKKYLTSKLIILILIAAVSLLLLFLNPRNFFSPVRKGLFIASYPFQKTFYLLSQKSKRTFKFLGSISDLHKENEKLIKENNVLIAQLANLSQEKEENETLREQLGLAPRGKFNLESCFVIGQDPQRLGSWLMIDKGRSSGIEIGMPVIVSDGILVGRIDEVYTTSSRVNLLSSVTSSINVADLGTGAKGIARGEFGLGVIMDMIAQTDIINAGDEVVTSGLGSNVAKGLYVGKIQEIRNTPDKLFQQASIAPRVKYSEIDVVFVIKNQ